MINKEHAPQYITGALLLLLTLAYLYIASLPTVDPRGNPNFTPEPGYTRVLSHIEEPQDLDAFYKLWEMIENGFSGGGEINLYSDENR